VNGEALNSALPDRLATREEILLATTTTPDWLLEFCSDNELLRAVRTESGTIVDLSRDHLDCFLGLDASEDPATD
jgi:hypothetical protein